MAFFQNSSILCLVLKDQKLPGVKQYSRRLDKGSKLIPLCWWLARATYVVDGLFFGHFFWKVVGTVRIHVSHVQLPYT